MQGNRLEINPKEFYQKCGTCLRIIRTYSDISNYHPDPKKVSRFD